jgi:hypothetical protein
MEAETSITTATVSPGSASRGWDAPSTSAATASRQAAMASIRVRYRMRLLRMRRTAAVFQSRVEGIRSADLRRRTRKATRTGTKRTRAAKSHGDKKVMTTSPLA